MKRSEREKLGWFLFGIFLCVTCLGFCMVEYMANQNLRSARAEVIAVNTVQAEVYYSDGAGLVMEDREVSTLRWQVGGETYERRIGTGGRMAGKEGGTVRIYYDVGYEGVRIMLEKNRNMTPHIMFCLAVAAACMAPTFRTVKAYKRYFSVWQVSLFLIPLLALLPAYFSLAKHLSIDGWEQLKALDDGILIVVFSVYLLLRCVITSHEVCKRAEEQEI